MTDTVFDVRNVTYRYNEVTALDDLTVLFNRGGRYAILGANGSGKSTLLRILDGLYFPESGSVEFLGEPLNEEKFRSERFSHNFRRRVGFVFQNPDVQLFNPTVFDEVAFGPLQLRWEKNKIKERISNTLELMELAHLKDRPPPSTFRRREKAGSAGIRACARSGSTALG